MSEQKEDCSMWSWQRALMPLGLVAGGIVCLLIPGGQAFAPWLISGGVGLATGTSLKPVPKSE